MKELIKLIVVLLLALPAVAQVPPEAPAQRTMFPNVPPGTTYNVRHSQPIRYQTTDGQWHNGQLSELRTDRLYLVNEQHIATAYLPSEVRRLVLDDVVYGGVGRYFARELTATGPVMLYQYQDLDGGFFAQLFSTKWWLRRVDGAVIRLRAGRMSFSRQMLGVVGDDAQLAARLQARAYRRRDAVAILDEYESRRATRAAAVPRN